MPDDSTEILTPEQVAAYLQVPAVAAHQVPPSHSMTYDEALEIAAAMDDPDEYLQVVGDLLALRWSDGAPVVG